MKAAGRRGIGGGADGDVDVDEVTMMVVSTTLLLTAAERAEWVMGRFHTRQEASGRYSNSTAVNWEAAPRERICVGTARDETRKQTYSDSCDYLLGVIHKIWRRCWFGFYFGYIWSRSVE